MLSKTPVRRQAVKAQPLSGAVSSIKVVSELSEIPMGTLRAWERRYGFPTPARREGSNRRVYTAEQIERLREIARALRHGYRPGDVIHLAPSQLTALLDGQPEARSAPNGLAIGDVPVLLGLLLRDDAQRLEDELRLAAAALGARRVVMDVAQPLAEGVGKAWAAGSLAVRHEHLLTECLSTQLRALLAAQLVPEGAPAVVLATLPGEPHTLGLQMVALYVALGSARPRLLGANTPPEQVLAAAHAFRARAVGIALTPGGDLTAKRRHLQHLARALPSSITLWVGGSDAKSLGKLPERIEPLLTWSRIDTALARLHREAALRPLR